MVDYSEIGSAVFAQEEVRKNYWKSLFLIIILIAIVLGLSYWIGAELGDVRMGLGIGVIVSFVVIPIQIMTAKWAILGMARGKAENPEIFWRGSDIALPRPGEFQTGTASLPGTPGETSADRFPAPDPSSLCRLHRLRRNGWRRMPGRSPPGRLCLQHSVLPGINCFGASCEILLCLLEGDEFFRHQIGDVSLMRREDLLTGKRPSASVAHSRIGAIAMA